MQTGLPGAGSATAKGFAWHQSAIGYAVAKDAKNIAGNGAVAADITWHGDRAAHFVNHMMSGQACLIDDTGVIESKHNDTTPIPTGWEERRGGTGCVGKRRSLGARYC